MDEDAGEIANPTRRFSVLDITSGLPDDSREAEEREVERRLAEIRARVKSARAVVATTPGLANTLQRDWRKVARFYARFGITETLFRNGVPAGEAAVSEDLIDQVRAPSDRFAEVRVRAEAALPVRA